MSTRMLLFMLAVLAAAKPLVAAVPANDRINRATEVSALPFEAVLDTSAATTAFNDPACVGQGPTVWFRYRPTHDTAVQINTFGSHYDTTLSVYTYTPGRVLAQLACNDDYDGYQSQVSFTARSGVTYYVMVGAYASGPGGYLTLEMTEGSPQPAVGASATVASATLDASTGLVTVQGTTTCSRPQYVYVFGHITQKRGGGQVQAFFGTEFVCDQTGRWTATSSLPRPRGGNSSRAAVFGNGRAVISARVLMWDSETGELTELQVLRTVRLP